MLTITWANGEPFAPCDGASTTVVPACEASYNTKRTIKHRRPRVQRSFWRAENRPAVSLKPLRNQYGLADCLRCRLAKSLIYKWDGCPPHSLAKRLFVR